MRRKSGMVTQKLTADEIMVVPTAGDMINKVLTLNGSAGFVWELLKEDRSETELVRLVAEEYGISESQAKEDISELLNTIKNYIE